MTVLWGNVPARFWLWRHQRHRYRNLTGAAWTCSCGSVFPPGKTD